MEVAMRVLVTGGSGAIGRYVVAELRRAGHEVTILDMRPPQNGSLALLGEGRGEGNSVRFIPCDLTDYKATCTAVVDCDVVVHLAAIPNPANDPPERVLAVNTVSSFNVLEAVRLNHIRRVVYGCSDSSTGFGIHNVVLKPLYLPINEEHPCWPHETYSLSKRFGEEMLEWYVRAYAFEGIALRYMWVWTERDTEGVRQLVRRHLAGEWNADPWFGAYIAPHDVAQGVRQACDYRFPETSDLRFEPFYLSAAHTFYPVPTLEVLRRIYTTLPDLSDVTYFAADPYASVFDTRKAQRLLGYRATRDWRQFDSWGPA
jgi:UDP-glucose 4-epimerase